MYLAANLQCMFCPFLLTFQDCVQLNQYTLKDEIGKVSILGARTSQMLWGSPLELGLGEESLEARVEAGFYDSWSVLFLYHNVNVFCKSTENV